MVASDGHDEGFELFLALAERSDEPVFVCTPSGRLCWCNGAFVRHFGERVRTGEPAVEQPGSGGPPEGVVERVAAVASTGPFESALWRLADASGRVRPFLVTSSRCHWRKEVALLGVARPTASRGDERSPVERGFEAIFEGVADAIVRLTSDGRVLLANGRFRELVGQSSMELTAATFFDFVHPEDRRRVVDAFESLDDPRVSTLRAEFRGMLPSGSVRWFEASVSRLDDEHHGASVLAVVRDTSDARRLEAKAREAQTLESLGELARGIAHTLSDLMTTVVANASLLQSASGLPAALAPSVAGIPLAAARVERLSRMLLTYAGKAPRTIAPVDVGGLVDDEIRRFRARAPSALEVRVSLAAGALFVNGDAPQLGELAQSLLVNAAEAIDGAGEVRVEVLELAVDGRSAPEPRRWIPTEPGPGRYACLRVTDTGAGMEPQLLSKAFFPFVTTKGTGRGLGLPSVLGIARGHSGTVGVWSTPRRGTTVEVLLPLAQAVSAAEAAALSASPASPAVPAPQAKGCVLVVDDEAMICDLERRILDLNGYSVECADDGQAAMERFNASPERFDVVIVDHSMPGLRGDALACRLRAVSASVGLVHASGLRDEAVLGRLPRGTVLLEKPFTANELVEAVEAALRGSGRVRGGAPP